MSIEATPSSYTISEVIEECNAEYQRSGRKPTRQETVAKFPHLASELEAFFNGWESTACLASGGVLPTPLPLPLRHRPDEAPPFGPGAVMSRRYEVVKYVGGGGMAWVYQAIDLLAAGMESSRTVALKVRKPSADPRRFAREPDDTPKHENVIAVLDKGCVDGMMFYVMEFADDGDLATHIDRFRRNPRATARLLAQVSRGIACAHSQKIIHRDLKPANILLMKDGTAKVSDFGLAKHWDQLGAQPVTELTPPGMLVGTPPYMDPEQLRGEQSQPSVDVWAIGVILYQMLTDQLPFRGRSIGDVAASQRKKIVPPRGIDPNIPHTLNWLCLECLQRNPNKRPSPELVAAVLEEYAAGRVHERVPTNTRWARARRWFGAHRELVTTFLAFLAASGTGIAMFCAAYEKEQREVEVEKARRLETALDSNTAFATHVAGNVLFQLNQYSAAVVEIADDPEFLDVWRKENVRALQAKLQGAFERYNRDQRMRLASDRPAPTFASFYVIRANGEMVVRSPMQLEIEVARHFPNRDYLRGATQHSRAGRRKVEAVHISRVFESKWDGLFKFAISVPFFSGPQDKPVYEGAVVATLTTDSTLGLVSSQDTTRKVALIAPRDPNQPTGQIVPGDRTAEYVVFIHPAYNAGDRPVRFPADQNRMPHADGGPELRLMQTPQSILAKADYRDPVAADEGPRRDYQGRWLAGFAQVGNTELMVVVQQRYEDPAGEPDRLSYGRVLLTAIGVALAVAVAALLVTRWFGAMQLNVECDNNA